MSEADRRRRSRGPSFLEHFAEAFSEIPLRNVLALPVDLAMAAWYSHDRFGPRPCRWYLTIQGAVAWVSAGWALGGWPAALLGLLPTLFVRQGKRMRQVEACLAVVLVACLAASALEPIWAVVAVLAVLDLNLAIADRIREPRPRFDFSHVQIVYDGPRCDRTGRYIMSGRYYLPHHEKKRRKRTCGCRTCSRYENYLYTHRELYR